LPFLRCDCLSVRATSAVWCSTPANFANKLPTTLEVLTQAKGPILMRNQCWMAGVTVTIQSADD